jgi:hypothetical protein
MYFYVLKSVCDLLYETNFEFGQGTVKKTESQNNRRGLRCSKPKI